MFLGSFPADSTFMYLGFWIFSETLKLMKPWYPVIVTAVVFYLVWHSLKTGDWLHNVGGYFLYVILLICLLSHTTTISLANIKPRSKRTESQTAPEEAVKKLAVSVSSVRVPTVFLFTISAIDSLTNKLADIISNGHYLAGAFDFIHAQAAIANTEIVGKGRGDFIHFCVECFSKARTDIKNGKYKGKSGVINPQGGFREDWYIGHSVYKELYQEQNHKIIWNGKEISCLDAYEQLNESLLKDIKDKLRLKEIEAAQKDAWGDKYKKWLAGAVSGTRDWFAKRKIGKAASSDDLLLYRILKKQYRKLSWDPTIQGRICRELLPGDEYKAEGLFEHMLRPASLAKDRGTGLLGGMFTTATLLAKVSLFIRIAPFVQGACLCLCISAFPFLIFLSLFPRSVRIIRAGFLFIFQVSMWTVCWSIIDMLSLVLPKIVGGGFAIERIDIPMFILLMYVVAPIISMVFIRGAIGGIMGMLAVPAGNPADAVKKVAK